MKIIIRSVIACLALCWMFAACTGCSGDKNRARSTDSVPTFSKADTTEVVAMCETYLNHLKAKEYDQAIGMLNYILNDTVHPLPEADKATIIKQQNVFPVLDYTLESMEFKDPNNVILTYSIKFFEKPEGSDIPNTIRIAFSPQRINGQWYLELMNKSYITSLYTPVSDNNN